MSRRPALPVSLHVSDRKILVVGDDEAATERRRRLERAGAAPVCVARADYDASHCEGAFAVFACGDDREHDRIVAADARAAGCLVYAQDQPDLSDFAMPAISKRGPLTLAVSTDAAAPALSRRLREQLDALLDAAGDDLDALVAELEARRAQLPTGDPRMRELYAIASRLRVEGAIVIDPD